MRPDPAPAARVLVCAWDRFQPRTSALGPALGGEAQHIHGDWPGEHPMLLPLRYLADAVRMWRRLRQWRPDVLLVVTPPVIAPLVAWLWSAIHGTRVVIDCHTSTLHERKWRWSTPIHRRLFQGCKAVLVHTEADRALLQAWGLDPLLLPDDLPSAEEAALVSTDGDRRRVLVAGSFAWDEPVDATLAAARLMPTVEFRLTGDPGRLDPSIRGGAPANAVFTGYLPYPKFLGELLVADAVAVFTTDRDIMNRAAFETIGLERPLVLSDLPQLRGRFEGAAVFCANEPRAMADAIGRALRNPDELTSRVRAFRHHLIAQRESAIRELRVRLDLPPSQPVAALETIHA